MGIANPDTIAPVMPHGIPEYHISWSLANGWRVQVAIHDSTMYMDGMKKVFPNCDSPEHAFTLAQEWVKEILPRIAEGAKSLTASGIPCRSQVPNSQAPPVPMLDSCV